MGSTQTIIGIACPKWTSSSLIPGTTHPPIPGLTPNFGINLTHQRLTSDFDRLEPRRNQSSGGSFVKTGVIPCRYFLIRRSELYTTSVDELIAMIDSNPPLPG